MTASAQTISVAAEVVTERERQDAKWGEQNHSDGTGPTTEPLWHLESFEQAVALAEDATTLCQQAAINGECTWRHILLEEVFEALAENEPAALRRELIQVAAVAQQWVEAIDRRTSAEVTS